MVKGNSLLVLALMVVSIACLGSHAQQAEKDVQIEKLRVRIPTKDTVLDYKVFAKAHATRLQLLVRDVDDAVKTYTIDYRSPDDQVRSSATFDGYAVASADSYGLPNKQIPITVIRSSCLAEGKQYFGIVTLGLVKEPVLDVPHYGLYVLKKLGSQYSVIYSLDDAGANLLNFIFRDFNEDCRPEMIDVSRPAGLSFLNVRTLDSDDRVNLVQEIAGKSVLLTETKLDQLAITLFMSDGSIQGPKQFYTWSKDINKFVEAAPQSIDVKVFPDK